MNLTILNAEIMFIGLFGTANYFGRLANYFLIFQALCLPHLFKAFNETSRKLITSACIIGFLLYFYYANVINQNFDSMFNYVPFINYIKSIIGSLFL
ncbi:EpsG family protein [Coprobacillaceae bacterium CR2/5/TPMF4]|nr:EpsG family protein [Coprobacillaceae bacterium CR2/5/TPMF4]